MKTYKIEQRTIYTSSLPDEVSIINGRTSLYETNMAISSCANTWEHESNLIQHHAGQSVVFFNNKRIEFTRLPEINTGV